MELPNRPIKDPYREVPVKDFSYINTQKKPAQKSRFHLGWLISGAVLLILLGVGAYLYGQSSKPSSGGTAKKSSLHKTASSTKAASNSSVPAQIPMTTYTSSTFNLTVSYPTSWTSTANGNTSFSFTSPEMYLTAASGSQVEGRVILGVFNQGAVPAAFGSASVAVLNSQIVAYTSPTPTQAAQTYISFVQYPATTIVGGLDGIYVSGNDGYIKDQSIPVSDVNTIDPLIIASFEQCQNAACTTTTNLTIASSMWSSQSFSAPIIDILKSFSFS